MVVLRQTDKGYPEEWDPRVVELADFVQRERGALYEHPVPVEFLSPEEYSDRARTDEGTLSEDDKAELEQFEGTLRALGLLGADVDLFQTINDLVDTGTLAFYDTEEERVVVRGTEVTPGVAVTLVHELTHVLQDQVFDLDRFDGKEDEVTTGQTYAFGALAEADADRIEGVYRDTLDQATKDVIDAESDAGLADFENADIPTALTSLFASPYALGDAFLAVLKASKGRSVDAAFSKPPTTEEQILDAFEYIADRGPLPVDSPEGGATAEQAKCFGSVVVNGLTLEDLAADELSPSLQRKIAELVQACQ